MAMRLWTFRVVLLAAAVVSMAAASPARGQAPPPSRIVLVLDGSGSMWGQIGGEAKIGIARRAIRDLVERLGAEHGASLEIGLMAYGQQRKGDCNDISMVVPIGPLEPAHFLGEVERLSPKGKTPISDAVRMAADMLRYSEEKATVILVSDGEESCDRDPCEVARELEATGVDFTAHVIGFEDVEAEARRQLRCIAEQTGGTYVTAGSVPELASALITAAEMSLPPAAPPAAPAETVFAAVDPTGGELSGGGFSWTFINSETEATEVLDDSAGEVRIALPPGPYEVFVASDRFQGEGRATVTGGGERFEVALYPRGAPASFAAPTAASAGSVMEFAWQGPTAPDDLIFIMPVGEPDSRYPLDDRVRHHASDGSPARLVAPAEPGRYEIRYMSWENAAVLARQPIEIGAPDVAIEAPARAAAGERIEIPWRGPAAKGDLLFVGPADWASNVYQLESSFRHDAAKGSPALLTMPREPGLYEIRYFSGANGRALVRLPIEATAHVAALEAPDSAAAGSLIEVAWTGPAFEGDGVFIAPTGEAENRYPLSRERFHDVKGGSPLRLVVPVAPGPYEIRYFSKRAGPVLARVPLTVLPPTVTLDAPRTAAPGSMLELTWEGPTAPGDMLFIAPRDWKGNQYPISRNHPATDGSPARLAVPAEAGTYEIRYFSGANGDVLAKRALLVR
jgi:Ca-activated chloride channel family protein